MIIAPAEVSFRLFAVVPTWTDAGLVWFEWVRFTLDRSAFAIFTVDKLQ
jgi:hypothetical protein